LGGLGNQEKLNAGVGGSFNWLCDLLGHFSWNFLAFISVCILGPGVA